MVLILGKTLFVYNFKKCRQVSSFASLNLEFTVLF